jgi:hypothetical protein
MAAIRLRRLIFLSRSATGIIPITYRNDAVESEQSFMAIATSTKPTVSMLERVGTGAAGLGVLALAGVFVYPLTRGTITTLGDISPAYTTLVGLVIGATVLGLLGTVLSLPGLLKERRLGRGLSTFFAGATLITGAIFMLVTALPHAQNLQNLQNKTAPFGYAIRDNCQNPLNDETTRYKAIAHDADSAATPTDFQAAMAKDVPLVKGDVQTLQNALTKLNALSVPAAKYQALKDGCIKDVTNTIGFFTSSSGVPTDAIVAGAGQIIDGNASIPAALKPLVKESIKATLPASLSAEDLLIASSAYSNGTAPVKLSADVPPEQAATVTGIVQSFLSGGVPTVISTVFTTAANQKDQPLTDAGDQLKQDIKTTLTTNTAPFSVDADKIVG